MIVAYIDESGTQDRTGRHKDAKVAVVGGIVGAKATWDSFALEWKACLDKFDLNYFHMNEWKAAHLFRLGKKHDSPQMRHNPFKKLSVAQLETLVLTLASIVGSGHKIPCGAYVKTDLFYKAKASGQILITADPYEKCIGDCYTEVAYMTNTLWPNHKGEISLVFDQTDDPRWLNAVMNCDRLWRSRDPRFIHVRFNDKKLESPLQAADMLANRMRTVTNKFVKRELLDRDFGATLDRNLLMPYWQAIAQRRLANGDTLLKAAMEKILKEESPLP